MTDLAKQVLETLVHQLRAYAKAYVEFDGACSDAANMINRLMVCLSSRTKFCKTKQQTNKQNYQTLG